MGALTKKKKIYKWVRRPGIDVLVPGAGFSLACCPQKSAHWRREEASGEARTNGCRGQNSQY